MDDNKKPQSGDKTTLLKLVKAEAEAPLPAKPKSRLAAQLAAWADQLDKDIDLIKSW